MMEFNARDNLLQKEMDKLHRRIAEENAYLNYLKRREQQSKAKILDLEHKIETIENDLFGGTE